MSHAASLEFFETGILEAANLITTPFALRVEILKFNEPAHAISHLIEQAQIVENTLKECIQMCSFVLEKHKEVIDDLSNLQVKLHWEFEVFNSSNTKYTINNEVLCSSSRSRLCKRQTKTR